MSYTKKVVLEENEILETLKEKFPESFEGISSLDMELDLKRVVPVYSLNSQSDIEYENSLGWVLTSVGDNNDTFVNVVNAVGEGILKSILMGFADSGADVTVEINIDGAGLETMTIEDFTVNGYMAVPMNIPFETSCLVKMKCGGIGSGIYGAVYGVK